MKTFTMLFFLAIGSLIHTPALHASWLCCFAEPENTDTHLHIATALGSPRECAWLLKKGVRIDAKNQDGNTPLHYAVVADQKEICALFLEYDANTCAKNDDGYTPLHYAACTGHQSICVLLLKYSANVTFTDDQGGTALELANGDAIKKLFATYEDLKVVGYLKTIADDTPQVITFLIFSFSLGQPWYRYVRR